MRSRSSLPLLFLTVAVLGVAVGCGSDSTGSAHALHTSSLSKAQYVEKTEAICEGARKTLLPKVLVYLQRHEPKNPSRAEEAAVFTAMTKAVLLPTIKREMAEIRQLGAPDGNEDEVEEFLVAEQEAVNRVAKLKNIASRFQVEHYFDASSELAPASGLEACANSEAYLH